MESHIDREFFIMLFGEFASANPKRVEAFIELASCRLSRPDLWKGKIKEATALLAAHMMTVLGSAGGGGAIGGAVNSESVGDLSRGYSAVSVGNGNNDDTFYTTGYGQQYLELRRSCVVSAGVLCPSRSLGGLGLG